MTTPAWAVREWRPLVRQLLATMAHDSRDDGREEEEEEPLATAADRAVAALYAHRFLEPSQQQVATELEQVAVKLEVHSLGARARRLRALATGGGTDANALKLLLALAETPTAASDAAAALDEAPAAVRAQRRRVAAREQEHATLRERLAEELFEVATNDEWYEQWADDSDEDSDGFGGLGSDSDDEGGGGSEWSGHANFRIGVERASATEEEEEEAEAASRAARTRSGDREDARASGGDEDMEAEAAEIRERDELLLRYFPRALPGAAQPSPLHGTGSDGATDAEVSDSDAMAVDEEVKNQTKAPSMLSLESPGLLYAALQRQSGSQSRAGNFSHRLVHERALVAAVFQALAGIDSFVFEVVPVAAAATPQSCFRDGDHGPSVRLSQAARGVAVGHLSPTALHRFLQLFARAASELQQMRGFVACIARDAFDALGRCCTLEGLAHALAATPLSSPATQQTTLLAVYGDLKPLFSTISWLKCVLAACFPGDSDKATSGASAAERAKAVLDALYAQLEVEYIQGIHHSSGTGARTTTVADASAPSTRYGVVLHLFVNAVAPYLDLLQTLLFERGHADTLALHDELFFAAPLAARRGGHAPSSPLADAESPPSFKDALLALAPFEVDARLVPVFLAPAIPLLNEAIASRQMTNRYLQQREARNSAPLRPRGSAPRSLSELFVGDLAASGVYTSDNPVDDIDRASGPDGDALTLSARLSVQNMPFGRTIKHCLLQHVERKCRELNGAMATLFRERLQYLDHVDALRAFVLMQQQDVFAMTSAHLLQQMQQNPITLADSESINSFFHSVMHRMHDERVVSDAARHAGSRLCVRVNATQLKALGVARKLDISALRCLYFTLAAPQPLRVLFSASVMRKYARLATFLLQVKAVESAIIKFKRNLRYKRCFKQYVLNDMLHYTKSLLNYLSSQVANTGWDDVRRVLETSESLVAMDRAHEQYLDQLLSKFFLLDKHKTVVQYILTTFNHIMRFTSHVDELVKAVERNLPHYFPGSGAASSDSSAVPSRKPPAPLSILHRSEHRLLHDEMAKSASEFKRQSHFLVVMLTAMHKHGASPH
ncbi:hypothetical protein PybrP1_006758, partial [[Pythium] brassicae (nom. inval.)]